MNFVDRVVAAVSPQAALQRAIARRRLAVTMSYDAAGSGVRTAGWHPRASSADTASRSRARIAHVSRDMVRNSPLATRAQMVITNAVIGDGVIPKISFPLLPPERRKRREAEALALIAAYLDTTVIDAAGQNNLYGLQRLVMQALVTDGEVLVVEESGAHSDRRGRPLPKLKLRVLEIDHLDRAREGGIGSEGHYLREGIEYDATGQRVAYWVHKEHPGEMGFRGVSWNTESERIAARHVHHIFRMDRPGQTRGVSWFAPVVLALQDFADYQDAQIMRQKVAAMFAAFRTHTEAPNADQQARDAADIATLHPGAVVDLFEGEEVHFGTPPGVEGYDEFTRVTLRSVASGLGITYEALSGDLSNVNFSSYRVGYVTMERNISSWQWTLLVPQLLQPLATSILEAWQYWQPELIDDIEAARVEWTPPARFVVDPQRELATQRDAVRSGFVSRQSVIRSLGHDPETVLAEIAQDKAAARAAQLVFDSDPELVSGAGQAQGKPVAPAITKDSDDDTN